MNNEEKLRRMLFLSEYKNSSADKTLINENIDTLLESKQTEDQARAILRKGGVENADHLIQQFKQIDQTETGKVIPLIAQAYGDEQNMEKLRGTFTTVSNYVKDNKMPVPMKTKRGYEVKDQVFDNYLRFTEYIHQLESDSAGHTQWQADFDKFKGVKADPEDMVYPKPDSDKATIDNTEIHIYDGNEVGKCITYGTGGLTGRPYQFCIGQPGASNMWQNYRDSDSASYYYVVDRTRDQNDPFHIVVWMPTPNGVLITHEPNRTRSESQFDHEYAQPTLGMGYRKYLESKGVDVDAIMPNVPKSEQEIEDTKRFGNQNTDLEWFKSLEFDEKMRYIGRGHLLSNEQFDNLWQFRNKDTGFNLLKKYVSLGQALPEDQFNILVGKNEQQAVAA